MTFTSVAWIVRNGGTTADFAGSRHRKTAVGRVFLPKVLLSHVLRREYGNKLSRCRGFLHVTPSTSLLPFHQAHHADDFKSEFARGLDGLSGGRPGGANVVYDYHPRAFFAKPFNPLTGAVLLFGFAHKEAMEAAAGHCDRHDDRVRAHGQSANRLRVPPPGANFFQENLPGQLRPARVQGGGAAVNVVVAAAAGSQLELPQPERLPRQQTQQFLTRGGHEFLR